MSCPPSAPAKSSTASAKPCSLAERARRIEAVVAGRRVDPITGISVSLAPAAGSSSPHRRAPHQQPRDRRLRAADGDARGWRQDAGDADRHRSRRDIALLRAPSTPVAFARFNAAPRDTDGRALTVAGYPAYGLPTIHRASSR